MGFTPEYLGTVWLGFDDNSSHGLSGSAGALSLWLNFMKTLEIKDSDFTRPSAVEIRDVPQAKPVLSKEVLQKEKERIQFFFFRNG